MIDESLVEIAEELAARFAPRGDEIEAARNLPSDITDAIADAGLLRLTIPAIYEGLEAHPCTFLKVVETLARADGSVGWVTNIMGVSAVNSAYLSEDRAQEVFAKPDTKIAGVFAPMGKAVPADNSYSVSGRWQWGSGTQNADWVLCGSMVLGDDGKPEMLEGRPNSRMMIVPQADVTFHDTWHVMGLCGTGSGDFEIKDQVVPQDMSVALASDKPLIDAPLYAFPAFGLLAIGVAVTGLGIAQGAIDDFIELSGAKKPQFSSKTLAQKQVTQTDYAKAEGQLRAARAFLYDATATAFAQAEKHGAIPDEDKANLRLAATNAAKTAAAVTTTLYTMAGGSSVFLKNSLQRRFRDAHVVTQHIMVGGGTYELTGRVLLGLESDTAML